MLFEWRIDSFKMENALEGRDGGDGGKYNLKSLVLELDLSEMSKHSSYSACTLLFDF